VTPTATPTRPIVRRTIALVVLVAAVVAGCSAKVDRTGSKQRIIDGLAKSGITGQQSTCVANVIDKFTDDELKQLDSGKASAALTGRMTEAVTSCVTGATGASTTAASGSSTTTGGASSSTTGGGGSSSSTTAGDSSSTTAADTSSTATAGSQLFDSDFEPVCRGVRLSRAAEYVAKPGQVSPVKVFVGKGSDLSINTGAAPAEWTIEWSQQGDALAGIQLVACADRTTATFVKECTGYSSNNGADNTGVVEFFDATYDVSIHSAKTGDVVGKGTINAKATDCPTVALFQSGETKTNEYAMDDAAMQTILKPYVQP
jgi:hypothetical protein